MVPRIMNRTSRSMHRYMIGSNDRRAQNSAFRAPQHTLDQRPPGNMASPMVAAVLGKPTIEALVLRTKLGRSLDLSEPSFKSVPMQCGLTDLRWTRGVPDKGLLCGRPLLLFRVPLERCGRIPEAQPSCLEPPTWHSECQFRRMSVRNSRLFSVSIEDARLLCVHLDPKSDHREGHRE
jgi:hypothetical protein